MSEEGPPPTRWEVELEFVQGLANPMYVHFLAQQKYLEDPDFLRYLEYLEYWREMPHVQYIVYPNCLLMLMLLKQAEFRQEIARVEVAQVLMDAFFRKWQLEPDKAVANGHGNNSGNVNGNHGENMDVGRSADEVQIKQETNGESNATSQQA